MKSTLEKPFMKDGICKDIQVINVKLKPSQNLRPGFYHYHNYIEFLYALDTNAYAFINEKKYQFKTGDIIIIPANTPHDIIPIGESNYICIKFLPSILHSGEYSSLEFKYILPLMTRNNDIFYIPRMVTEKTQIKGLISEIQQEWDNAETAYEMLIRSNLTRIFAWIFRYWGNTTDIYEQFKLTDSIRKAILYISEHYYDISEEQVAYECGLSTTYFSTMFKNATGQSFSKYVTQIRISEAEKYLLSTNKSVTEIAMDTGFSSSSYFISIFKKLKGLTPQQMRKKIAIQNEGDA